LSSILTEIIPDKLLLAWRDPAGANQFKTPTLVYLLGFRCQTGRNKYNSLTELFQPDGVHPHGEGKSFLLLGFRMIRKEHT